MTDLGDAHVPEPEVENPRALLLPKPDNAGIDPGNDRGSGGTLPLGMDDQGIPGYRSWTGDFLKSAVATLGFLGEISSLRAVRRIPPRG
jgi:hypothetical protein